MKKRDRALVEAVRSLASGAVRKVLLQGTFMDDHILGAILQVFGSRGRP